MQRPRLRALLASFIGPLQAAETATWSVWDALLAPTGAELDDRGSIVGAGRDGLDDDTYERLILAQIAANRSHAHASDLEQILIPMLPEGSTYTVRDAPPAGIRIDVLGPFAVVQTMRLLTLAKGAGIALHLVYEHDPDNGHLTPESDGGAGGVGVVGSVVVPSLGATIAALKHA